MTTQRSSLNTDMTTPQTARNVEEIECAYFSIKNSCNEHLRKLSSVHPLIKCSIGIIGNVCNRVTDGIIQCAGKILDVPDSISGVEKALIKLLQKNRNDSD